MQLNLEGRTRFQEHLKKILRQPCSVCGGGNWQIEDAIFEVREFAGGDLASVGNVKPIVSMTCTNCGHVLFMSPITTGIIQINQEAGASSEMPGVPQTENA